MGAMDLGTKVFLLVRLVSQCALLQMQPVPVPWCVRVEVVSDNGNVFRYNYCTASERSELLAHYCLLPSISFI